MRVMIFLLWVLCLPLPPSQGRTSAKNEAASRTLFVSGERLVYSVEWDPPWYFFFLPKMEAGEVELHFAGETEYKGSKALRIVFKARSSGILLKLAGAKIDDEFTYYSEPETFCSLAASKKVREGKRKRHIDVEYIREEGVLHFRETDESQTPPLLKKDEIKSDIPKCVRNPFSALYYFRTLPLKTEYSHDSLVGHDDKLKEVNSLVEKQEEVKTPAGIFPAWKVRTTALMGGLFKAGGQFRIWFSADERKIPVKFEAKVHLGRAIGKLMTIDY